MPGKGSPPPDQQRKGRRGAQAAPTASETACAARGGPEGARGSSGECGREHSPGASATLGRHSRPVRVSGSPPQDAHQHPRIASQLPQETLLHRVKDWEALFAEEKTPAQLLGAHPSRATKRESIESGFRSQLPPGSPGLHPGSLYPAPQVYTGGPGTAISSHSLVGSHLPGATSSLGMSCRG